MSFQIICQFNIGIHRRFPFGNGAILFTSITIVYLDGLTNLFYSIMALARPEDLTLIVIIHPLDPSYAKKIGICHNFGRTHKATARMAPYSYSVQIDKGIAGSQLFNGVFIINQRIVPKIAITISMIVFRTQWAAAPLSQRHDNKPNLSQSSIMCKLELRGKGLYLGTGIDVRDDGIGFS